jgi:VanZ family protein
VLFWPLLVVWTWKVLEPYPVPPVIDDALSFSDVAKLVVAKCLHAGVYVTLAGLAWVAVPAGRWRWAAVAFLLLHGAGTELGQHLMDVGRTGAVTDVLIDWAGAAAGVVVARRAIPARRP